ncbi:MAG: hypothetical protein GX907_05185 [Clostridiaceae bacterium]|nr:hypothetical protein [Clostridiaceae bacterium]
MFKLLAILIMTLDHIGHYLGATGLLPDTVVLILRLIGRLSFPMFVWLLALGYERTGNLILYFLRLVGVGLLTQAADIMLNRFLGNPLPGANILFSLAVYLVALCALNLAIDSGRSMMLTMQMSAPYAENLKLPVDQTVRVNFNRFEMPARLGLIIGILMLIICVVVTVVADLMYGLYGLAMALLFGLYRRFAGGDDPLNRSGLRAAYYRNLSCLYLAFCLLALLVDWLIKKQDFSSALLQFAAVGAVALFPLSAKEPKPRPLLRYLFYFYYPAHILLLQIIAALLSGKL